MKRKNYFNYILAIAVIILLNISSKVYSQNIDKLYEKIDLFSEVLEKIHDEYVDEVDQAEAMDSAINGLLQSLDPYSSYMNQKTFEESETEISGEFGGLGIEVTMEAGLVKVITPIDDTPASRAGVKAGDYITKINDEQVRGKTLMEAVNLMRGPIGTSIKITVIRKSLKKAKIFKIVREIIEIKSVTSKLIHNKVGYLRLKAFNQNSSDQLNKEISEIEKNKKLVGYILDLRNNPGGLLTQAIEVSNFFLDDGEIVSTKGRKKRENRKFFAKKGDKIAVLLGETTFGKGSVQTIIPLKNSGALRLTISKYYLPSGKSISEVGVLPDIKVEEEGEEFLINTKTDNQLNYAIKLFVG